MSASNKARDDGGEKLRVFQNLAETQKKQVGDSTIAAPPRLGPYVSCALSDSRSRPFQSSSERLEEPENLSRSRCNEQQR